ncbi:MAG: glutamate--tRNA ligase, partial [Pseudomonadota bacterium]
ADVIAAYIDRAETIGAMAASTAYLFSDEITLDPAAAKKHLRPVAAEPLAALKETLSETNDWGADSLGDTVAAVAERCGVGMGKVGMPARVAVTGGGASPGLGETLSLVGKSRSLARLDRALEYIEARRQSQ